MAGKEQKTAQVPRGKTLKLSDLPPLKDPKGGCIFGFSKQPALAIPLR
jgi:hypothetical protein